GGPARIYRAPFRVHAASGRDQTKRTRAVRKLRHPLRGPVRPEVARRAPEREAGSPGNERHPIAQRSARELRASQRDAVPPDGSAKLPWPDRSDRDPAGAAGLDEDSPASHPEAAGEIGGLKKSSNLPARF